MIEEKWKEKIEKEIEELKQKSFDTCMVQTNDKFELKELIRQAVEQGNTKIMTKLEEHEKRIIELENQDAKKALLIIKSVGGTTLGWLVLYLLNYFLKK